MSAMTELLDLPAPAAEPGGGRSASYDVSVVVPVTERPEPLAQLYSEYAPPLRAAGYHCEFVFVVEPWFRLMVDSLAALIAAGEPIRVLVVGQAMGETSLLKVAAAQSRAPLILTLPAYRRVEASSIPHLIGRLEQGADLVIARRWPRRDSWVNRVQSRVFHSLVGGLTESRVHDIACGVRLMRREAFEEFPLYGDFSRFLPLLALRDGYRVEEVSASQHAADAQARFYSPGTYLRRLIDLLGLFFLLRFTEKPLRFFGLLGGGLGLAGGVVLLVLLVQRLGGTGIADRPLLLLGVLLVVLGAQAVSLGLIGEIIVHLHAPRRRPYRLKRSAGARSAPRE